MELLILLALLWLVWLVSSRRWRKWFIQPLAGIVLVYVIVTSPVMVTLATWGLAASLPVDSGETVDAIVVLGRGDSLRDLRIDLAKKLWENKRAPQIFASGMLDARAMVQFWKDTGIPPENVGGEECSQSTEENGIFVKTILYPQGVRKVLLVTDTPHMLRAVLIFRSLGFTVIPVQSPLPSTWNSTQKLSLVLREYLALAKYSITKQFQQQTVQGQSHSATEVFSKIANWNCKF